MSIMDIAGPLFNALVYHHLLGTKMAGERKIAYRNKADKRFSDTMN